MVEQLSPAQIPVRYEKADGYRLVPANGVYGGITPKGEVIAHFFVDHNAMPESTHFQQQEGEPPGTYREVFPQDRGLVRTFQFAVMLSAREAKSVGRWLVEKADSVLPPEGAPPNV